MTMGWVVGLIKAHIRTFGKSGVRKIANQDSCIAVYTSHGAILSSSLLRGAIAFSVEGLSLASLSMGCPPVLMS